MKGTYSEHEIGEIVGDEHGQSTVCEVETVAQPDQTDGDEVVHDELLEILPTLLQSRKHDQHLLDPIARL